MSVPVLVGYFPKRSVLRPDWLAAAGVEEICSVSTCIAEGPEGWIDAWRHNAWGFFDTPEEAWSVVPEAERGAFRLYAYELHPFRFEGGVRVGLAPESTAPAPLAPGFELLGHDVVSRGAGRFECSPLSCNSWAVAVGANRWCLVDDAEEAFTKFCDAAGIPEP